jgi:hypothetical protein
MEIAKADEAFKQTAEFYKTFSKVNIDSKKLTQFINNVFEFADVVNQGREQSFKDKQHETIIRLFETGRGSELQGVRGTLWGAYNAVTEFIQHEQGNKGTLEDKRLDNAWFGTGMKLNQQAFKVAKEMVAA